MRRQYHAHNVGKQSVLRTFTLLLSSDPWMTCVSSVETRGRFMGLLQMQEAVHTMHVRHTHTHTHTHVRAA